MASRVTAYKVGVLLAGGSTRVSAYHAGLFVSHADAVRVTKVAAGVFANDKTRGPRVTRLHAGVFANDKTNGPRITRYHAGVFANDKTNGPRIDRYIAGAWVSLDQGTYMAGPFGGPEIWNPDVVTDLEFATPEPPVVEVNPFRADVPNEDLQRIHRELHDLVQAGDTTFHWGLLTEIYSEPQFTLGSLGKFYHDDYGLIHARYVRFTKWKTRIDIVPSAAQPVGLALNPIRPWTVTNDIDHSSVNLAAGIALPYKEAVQSGEWYGWMITDGLIPAEIMTTLAQNRERMFGTQYGWSATGELIQELDGVSLGYRHTLQRNLRLRDGEFYVQVERWGDERLKQMVEGKLAPVSEKVQELFDETAKLESELAAAEVQIEEILVRLDANDVSLKRNLRGINISIKQIRDILGSGVVTQEFVKGETNFLRSEVIERDKSVMEVAVAAWRLSQSIESVVSSSGADALQGQIDALNAALGALNDRLVGFTVKIYNIDEPVALAENDTLVATLVGVNEQGLDVYEFVPKQFKVTSLADVQGTPGPSNGQTIVWDSALAKFKFGASGGGGGGGSGVSSDDATSWRLIYPGAKDNWGGTYIGYAEIQFKDAADNILSTGGVVQATRDVNSAWVPSEAFDGITNVADNGWMPSTFAGLNQDWISYTKASPWKPAKVTVFPPVNHVTSFGKTHGVQFSTDGGWTWHHHSEFVTASPTAGVGQTFDIPATGASDGGGGGGGGASRTAPTLVQKVAVRAGGSFALPAAPTVGNLLVMHAVGFSSISAFALAGFYFVGTFQSNGNNVGSCWARRVQAGDTGSYSVASSTDKQAVLYEFSGSDGVLPVFGGAHAITSGAFSTAIPFHPLVPEGEHLLAIETDNAQYYTVTPETGWEADYVTPPSTTGNHYAVLGRYREGFDGTIAGSISGSPLAPYMGAFVVVGSAT